MATDKKKLRERIEKIKELVGSLCTQKLNEEYFSLSEKVIDKLGRKRPSPLLRGKEEIWAAGVIHAIGFVNFLFDKSTEPYLSADELNSFLGTKNSTVSNKAAQIRDLLQMDRLTNAEYMTRAMKDWNPLFNMVMVDGLMLPISSLPEEYQQLVREARERGEDIEFRSR